MPKPPPRNAFAAFLQDRAPGRALDQARLLPLAHIRPNPQQARQAFDESKLAELAASLQQHGLLQPVVVRPDPTAPGEFLLIAGERRLRAAQLAGLAEIPALIRDLPAAAAAILTAIENLQREDLDPEDEGRQYEQILTQTGWSQRELARQLGKDQEYVSRRLRMLRRPDLLAAVRDGTLTWHQAVSLLSQARPVVSPAETLAADDTPPVSPAETRGASTLPDGASAYPPAGLVERAVLDGAAAGGTSLPFRVRPVQQFRTWLQRTPPVTVPAAERATVRAELQAIQEQIAAFMAALADDAG